MKKSLIILIALLGSSLSYSEQSVIWGSEVIAVSSVYAPLQYSALQALHKPNVLPRGGANPNAWRPKRENSDEFIMVAFSTPIKAKQVAIAESENPAARCGC